MSLEADEEILQDFLVEAGEILELLSEQLVDLENRPDDNDLLNAIFRGFHTVKGGAGFLQLDMLVDLCHIAENIFDLLRNHKLTVTAELMDVVLQALDSVNVMFAEVSARQLPEPATPELMAALNALVSGESSAKTVPEEPKPAAQAESSEDITDAEFEEFLGAIETTEDSTDTVAQQPDVSTNAQVVDENSASDDSSIDLFDMSDDEPVASANSTPEVDPFSKSAEDYSSDEISDDEFESLLDSLHGKGKHGGVPDTIKKAGATPTQPVPEQTKPEQSQLEAKASKSDGLITDNEFERLLDELHGQGKGPTGSVDSIVKAPATTAKTAPVAPVSPTIEPPSEIQIKADEKPEPALKPKATSKGASSATKNPPPLKEPAGMPAEATVRVDTKRLDDIMNMVGELVLVRNRLVRLGLKSADEDMSKAVANLDVVTGDLQSAVMKTRMQPIKKVFGRFPRVVRDLARNLKKEINLELEGEETDLDKNLVEALADPLVHLVRNSVDHGIESPDERQAAGKDRAGRVVLSAEQEGDHIVLSISDDGAGMDPDLLRMKSVEKGVLDQESAERLSDQEAFNLIFHPGFSTKEEISDVSGRGVGMDVVKTKITQLNGSLTVESELGMGTKIYIKVPLTLAIMPTLMVMLGRQAFALPLVSVNEIFHLDLSKTNVVDGQEVVIVREKALPLFYLKKWLVQDGHVEATESHVVIVTVGTQKVGFVVDQLVGQEEVVIKPLGKMLQGTVGMAGATITGDGRIALILDVPGMLKSYAY